MWPNPQFPADLVTFTKESLMENFIFCALRLLNALLSCSLEQLLDGYFFKIFFKEDNDLVYSIYYATFSWMIITFIRFQIFVFLIKFNFHFCLEILSSIKRRLVSCKGYTGVCSKVKGFQSLHNKNMIKINLQAEITYIILTILSKYRSISPLNK